MINKLFTIYFIIMSTYFLYSIFESNINNYIKILLITLISYFSCIYIFIINNKYHTNILTLNTKPLDYQDIS